MLDLALIDDDRTATESLHVFHVVARQQNRHLLLGLIMPQKALHFALRDDIQANRGLVQQKDLWRMQERSDQFHSHSFTQRQFADRQIDHPTNITQISQLIQPSLEGLGLNRIDLAMQNKRFLSR